MSAWLYHQMDSVVNCVSTLMDPTTVTVWRDIDYLEDYVVKALSDNYNLNNESFMGLIYIVDINECTEMMDNCNTTDPAAQCVNLEGSYQCSCDKHVGYRLSSDGTTCEGNPCLLAKLYQTLTLFLPDVNECEGETHLCTGLCINTAGSYGCSCLKGFVLDEEDKITCHGMWHFAKSLRLCQY